MDDALPMLLFLGFIVGSMTLILVLGYQTRERELAAAEEEAPAPRGALTATVPVCAAAATATRSLAEGSTVARLEAHLRREHALAAAFVAEPTLERLLSSAHAPEDARVRDLEGRLREEHFAVSGFVAEPSVRGLFRAVRPSDASGAQRAVAAALPLRAGPREQLA